MSCPHCRVKLGHQKSGAGPVAGHVGVACQQGGLQGSVCKGLWSATLMATINLSMAPGLRSRLTKANHWHHLQVVLQLLCDHQPSLHGGLAPVLDDQRVAVDVLKHTALHAPGRVKKLGLCNARGARQGGPILSTTGIVYLRFLNGRKWHTELYTQVQLAFRSTSSSCTVTGTSWPVAARRMCRGFSSSMGAALALHSQKQAEGRAELPPNSCCRCKSLVS